MQTRFVKVSDAHVAYRVFGEGDLCILLFLGEYLPIDSIDEEPRYARCLQRLSSLGRVAAFNRRGVGLSDPPDGPVTQNQYVEDGFRVIEAIGAQSVVVFGWNVGGPAAIMFAARHPDRTSALLLANTYARMTRADDYPIGFPYDLVASTAELTTAVETETADGNMFDFLSSFAPSVADDERFRIWWDQSGYRGATPARSRELWKLVINTDVRDDLADIKAPTLVMGRNGLPSVELTRYVAEHIADATYREFEGNDLLWWVGNSDPYLNEIESFLSTSVGSVAQARRSLATVLFVDVVSSTQELARMGDRRWREILDTYHQLVRREIDRFGGQQISTSGDGFLATFAMPADAVRCATRLSAGVRALDIDIRAGIHTGEIEIADDDIAGIGVHIAARVQSAATPGEVWVSRTVADLVTGSGLRFEDRGEHELKGVPGRWALFSVEN